MRINLQTPFAEKDAVKALGARWDAARKIWYVTDVADLAPFMRWIPDLQAASEGASAAAPGGSAPVAAKPAARASAGVITKPSVAIAHCGCTALPWLDCPHTASGPASELNRSGPVGLGAGNASSHPPDRRLDALRLQ